MTVNIAPSPRLQYEDANGNPYAGAKLFTYAAGTTDKLATYTTYTGGTANTNPIILDSAGKTPYGVWLTEGLSYKFVLAPSTDSDPPTSPIFPEDYITGTNDFTSASLTWVTGSTPTYISVTSFSVAGDQTAILHTGRRLKSTVTSGTVYSSILTSSYGAGITTVTVVNDSTALDSGLSAVAYSQLTGTNRSVPEPLIDLDVVQGLVGGYVEFSISGNALTATVKTNNGNTPSSYEPVYVKIHNNTATTAKPEIVAITSALTVTAPSGATLGTISALASRIWCVAVNVAGTIVLGLYNSFDAVSTITAINEAVKYSTTAITDAADSSGVIYTTAGQTTRFVTMIGYVESTQTTAGTWAQALDKTVNVTQRTPVIGDIVSRAFGFDTAVSTGTTVVPFDDTTPGSAEGDQYMSATVSPRNGCNALYVHSKIMLTGNTANNQLIAFIYSTTNSTVYDVSTDFCGATGDVYTLNLAALIPANGTSHTLSVRAGPELAATMTYNGVAGNRRFGATNKSHLIIEEIFI